MEARWPAGFSVSQRGRRLRVSTESRLTCWPRFLLHLVRSSLTNFSGSPRAARRKTSVCARRLRETKCETFS